MKKISLIGNVRYLGYALILLQGILLVAITTFIVNRSYMDAWQHYAEDTATTVYVKSVAKEKQGEVAQYLMSRADEITEKCTETELFDRYNLLDNAPVITKIQNYIDGIQKDLWTAMAWFGFALAVLTLTLIGLLLMLIIALLQIIIFSQYMARSELKRLLIAFKGEFVALVGPSGCGKSTIPNMIGLLESYEHGEVRVFGKTLPIINGHRATLVRRGTINYLFQSFALITDMTVLQNLLLAM